MQNSKSRRGIFLVYTAFVAFCSILIVAAMFRSPSEPGNAVFLGLSLLRLVFASGLLVVFVFFVMLFMKGIKDREWVDRTLETWFGGGRFSKATAWLAGIGLGLGWIGCFLPSYRAGLLGNHWNRIQPMMAFLLLVSIATLVVFLLVRSDLSRRSLKISSTFRLSFVLFFAGVIVLGLMLYTKYGVHDLEDFWYGAGVPLLASQLLSSLLAGMIFLLVVGNRNSTRLDLAIFILLYAVTAVAWADEPLQGSFLFIDRRAPNQVFYPFADAAAFDVASQFGLIGQGIFIYNTPFFDRSIYLGFLVYLHTLFGQNYEILMIVQAALFAILSPLIYLIGRSLNMRAVGFASAVIATLRGINAIAASSMTDLVSPKMIMTDFPAAIGVALLVLFTCEWLKGPHRKWHYALWVGGAIGLTLMLRTNALVFLLLIPMYALFRIAPQWKTWLVSSVLILLSVIAITLPWELRNLSRGGTMYSSIVVKIQDVIRSRYSVPEPDSMSPQEKVLSLVTFRQTQAISSLYGDSYVAPDQPCNAVICFAPKHFLHNVVTSILILPVSPMLDDVRHVIKESHPFWRADWDGNFTPLSLFLFMLNVFMIVLGISVAWKQRGLQGLVPLAVFTFYNLSNAFARTSGGRYIVPMDWVIPLYFMIGILFLLKETAGAADIKVAPLFDPENDEQGKTHVHESRSPWLQTTLILTLLFGAGLLVPLSETLHSPRYAGFDTTQALRERETQMAEAGLELVQINEFLENPAAEILVGRTLYPRSYKLGQGEISFTFYPYTIMDFPRTGFFLIGPEGQNNILLPGGVPDYLPHAADALVIGCREQNYIDALMVIVLDEPGAVYTRSPMSELTCPLRQPVCENNSVCR
ncbi:MAG: hypothetical protein ABI621_14760 [Chloroflexota bacterium]